MKPVLDDNYRSMIAYATCQVFVQAFPHEFEQEQSGAEPRQHANMPCHQSCTQLLLFHIVPLFLYGLLQLRWQFNSVSCPGWLYRAARSGGL